MARMLATRKKDAAVEKTASFAITRAGVSLWPGWSINTRNKIPYPHQARTESATRCPPPFLSLLGLTQAAPANEPARVRSPPATYAWVISRNPPEAAAMKERFFMSVSVSVPKIPSMAEMSEVAW